MAKRGLYSNIAAKRRRIKAGSGEKMRKKGDKGHLLIKPSNKQQKQQKKPTKKRKRGKNNARVS